MRRPIYETAGNREKELAVAKAVSERWGVRCLMMPPLASADMLVVDAGGVPKCLVEIKSRNIVFGQYGHLHLSLDKVTRLQTVSDLLKIRAIIIADLNDGIFWHSIPPKGSALHTEMGGRRDRGDPKDLEEMACFFWDDFKRLV